MKKNAGLIAQHSEHCCGEAMRTILCLCVTIAMVVGAVIAQAQQANKLPKIGYLAARSGAGPNDRAFEQGLRELRYVEGQNIGIERRWGGGNPDRLPLLAAELVRLKVDILVTSGSTATRAAKKATDMIPIVMAQDPDPIGSGFVASLARPGGNITGLSNVAHRVIEWVDFSDKQLRLPVRPATNRLRIFRKPAW
jgi:putative tryptophan/tyrosine transport system substrate-binding protein